MAINDHRCFRHMKTARFEEKIQTKPPTASCSTLSHLVRWERLEDFIRVLYMLPAPRDILQSCTYDLMPGIRYTSSRPASIGWGNVAMRKVYPMGGKKPWSTGTPCSMTMQATTTKKPHTDHSRHIGCELRNGMVMAPRRRSKFRAAPYGRSNEFNAREDTVCACIAWGLFFAVCGGTSRTVHHNGHKKALPLTLTFPRNPHIPRSEYCLEQCCHYLDERLTYLDVRHAQPKVYRLPLSLGGRSTTRSRTLILVAFRGLCVPLEICFCIASILGGYQLRLH